MKYEAVFGDQSLFDGAPEDAEMVASVCQMPRWYTVFNGKVLFCDSKKESWRSADFNHPGSQLLAMRRIIAEPKRWTVEDQKAGRLPEVGCIVEYFNNNEYDDTEVTAQWRNGDELEILRHQNRNKAFVVFNARTERSSDLIVQCMKPIETPEEKAERLREEWCRECTSKFYPRGRCGFPEMIYDALLSGDLPVPVKE